MWIMKEDAAKAAKYKQLLYHLTGASFRKDGRKSHVPSELKETTAYKMIDKTLFDEYLTATPLRLRDMHRELFAQLPKDTAGRISKDEKKQLSDAVFDKLTNGGRAFEISFFDPADRKTKLARVRLIEANVHESEVTYAITEEGIEFYLSTCGGSCYDGLSLYDVIEASKNRRVDMSEEEAKAFLDHYYRDLNGQINGEPIRNWRKLLKSWDNHTLVAPETVMGTGYEGYQNVYCRLPVEVQRAVDKDQEQFGGMLTRATARRVTELRRAV